MATQYGQGIDTLITFFDNQGLVFFGFRNTENGLMQPNSFVFSGLQDIEALWFGIR